MAGPAFLGKAKRAFEKSVLPRFLLLKKDKSPFCLAPFLLDFSHFRQKNPTRPMRFFSLFFAIVFVTARPVLAQKDSLQKLHFLKGARALRADFFQQNRQKVADLADLEQKLNAIDSVRAARRGILNLAYYQKVVRQKDNERVRKDLIEATRGDLQMAAAFDDFSLAVLEANGPILGLRYEKILNKDWPYEVDEQADFFQECQFYGLRDGQKIGEIGAGDGSVSFLIGSSFRQTQLFVNEIDQKWLRLILLKARAMPVIERTGSRFQIVEGSKKSCGLEGKNLDRIVIRDSFHHFKKKKAMLRSIQKSLAPDGLVLVLEPTRDETQPLFCKKTMWRFEIEKAWREADFELLDTQRVANGKYFLFKFKKTEKGTRHSITH